MESVTHFQVISVEMFKWYALGWLTFGVILGYLLSQELPYLLALWSRINLISGRLKSLWHRPVPITTSNHVHDLAYHVSEPAVGRAVNRPRNTPTAPVPVVAGPTNQTPT